ncbi:hypothetical protein ACFV9W_06320 [Streptomyces sp. NPDC059897]|uniref:hypothetical protein n=1 Tax=Streptomyces sp. NPDC059897 TaxID=3346994 RepID=UPI003649EC11
MRHPRPASTEAAVTAVREVAGEYHRELSVTDDIGADQTSRRTSAGAFVVLDPDGALPHEAHIELGGSPSVSVRIFPEEDARITVENVGFEDVPRDAVPAFLRSVYGGLAYVKRRMFPPALWLIVPLSGDDTYKELILPNALSPWLSRNVR